MFSRIIASADARISGSKSLDHILSQSDINYRRKLFINLCPEFAGSAYLSSLDEIMQIISDSDNLVARVTAGKYWLDNETYVSPFIKVFASGYIISFKSMAEAEDFANRLGKPLLRDVCDSQKDEYQEEADTIIAAADALVSNNDEADSYQKMVKYAAFLKNLCSFEKEQKELARAERDELLRQKQEFNNYSNASVSNKDEYQRYPDWPKTESVEGL